VRAGTGPCGLVNRRKTGLHESRTERGTSTSLESGRATDVASRALLQEQIVAWTMGSAGTRARGPVVEHVGQGSSVIPLVVRHVGG